MPQVLAIGVAVHQATRSKKFLNLLHACGDSVDWVLQLETANEAVMKISEEGVYVPPFIINRKFVFFAIDNSDYNYLY